MAFDHETRAALRILEGITEGVTSGADAAGLVEDADPALAYLIVSWVRAHYGQSNEASEAVLGRLAAITARPGVTKLLKEGQQDPVVEWFEDGYSYRELAAKPFISMIVEKLEG